jgi:hypothetical protein
MYELVEYQHLTLTHKIIFSILIILLYLILLHINIILSILLVFIIHNNTYENLMIVPINFIRNCINANKIIKQYKNLLTVIDNQNKIIEDKDKKINDFEKPFYSRKMIISRNNIINDLKIQLEEKNKIINETNKCIICLDNTISYCCVPCGHTYCYDCIDKTNNCYICRGIIRNKIKLFF